MLSPSSVYTREQCGTFQSDRQGFYNYNNKGDRGQPWRVTRVRANGGETSLLVLTLASGAEYKSRTQEMNFNKLKLFSHCKHCDKSLIQCGHAGVSCNGMHFIALF